MARRVSGLFRLIPLPGDRERWRAVAGRKIPRLLSARRVLPLVIARDGNEAALCAERNIDFSATVSARTLNVASFNSFSDFFHLSFPKIISARTDDEGPIERA